MLSMRAHDHDTHELHPLGSADGDRSDGCRPAAHVPPAAGALALGAGRDRPEEAPPVNSESTSPAVSLARHSGPRSALRLGPLREHVPGAARGGAPDDRPLPPGGAPVAATSRTRARVAPRDRAGPGVLNECLRPPA